MPAHKAKIQNDYPSNNSQALDVIALAFNVTCALFTVVALTFFVSKKLISFIKNRKGVLYKEEYQLTSTTPNDEDDLEEMKRDNATILVQLAKARRNLKVVLFVAILLAMAGNYLGLRAVNYGISEQEHKG